jgi:hypothetical protein
MTTIAYVALIALGVFGLVMTGAFPTQRTIASLQSLNTAQAGLIAALERKAAALENSNEAFRGKAEAFENLAAEREKTLAIYRGILPLSGMPAPGLGTTTTVIGTPAEGIHTGVDLSRVLTPFPTRRMPPTQD